MRISPRTMCGEVLACPATGAMSGSMFLQHQASVTIKGQLEVPCLGCPLELCSCLRAVPNWPPGHHGRAGPGNMRAGELTHPSQLQYSREWSCKFRKLQVSCHLEYEHGRFGPNIHLPCNGMDKAHLPPLALHSRQQAGDLMLGP